jgi:Methyltransferase domain
MPSTSPAERLASLDLELFAHIPSESSDRDKQSLLALQRATRELRSPYVYLEIGSHLGGSLQPHVVDPLCERIYSIDKRPHRMPDARGLTYRYPDNSTERMRELLAAIPDADLRKLTCLDGDISEVPADRVERPDLCFIDGEHTDDAAMRDFDFCLDVLGGEGAIVFHDAQVVYNGIHTALRQLEDRAVGFHAYNLPDCVLVVELGEFPLHRDPAIAAWLLDNHVGYLASLRLNDHYRRFSNQPVFRTLRAVRARMKGTDTAAGDPPNPK